MKHLAAERATIVILFFLFLTSAIFMATPVPAHASAVSLTGKYIMAFLACNTSTSTCSNPQNHMTHLAESNDSINWSPVPGFNPYSGSVPDAIRRGDTIYLYNPGTMVRFNLDTGAQSQPTSVSLKFSNGTSAIFVDPSVFLDSNSVIHLFYLPGIVGQDPAGCPTGQSTCTKRIISATEVTGSDGGSFIVDQGDRVSYQINQCCFSDPAVFHGAGGYYLYVSSGQAVLAFESSTLTGTYAAVQGLSSGVLVPQGTGGVPAGYYDNATQSFWTFVSQGTTVEVIARASTPNINSQIGSSSFSTVVSGCTFQGLGCSYTVESPGFHLNSPGPTSATSTSTSTTSTPTSTTSFSASATSTSSSSTTSISPTTTSKTPSPTITIATTSSAISSTSSQTSSTSTIPAPTPTTSATTPSGGIPEFPYQLLAATIFSILVVASYLALRNQRFRRAGAETA